MSFDNQIPQESTCPQAGGFPLCYTAFSLVPAGLLEEENCDLWLNFMRERVPHDQHIGRYELTDDGGKDIVCLYEERSGRSHVIPYLLSQNTGKDGKEKVLAIREADHLAVIVYKGGNLQMANIFEAGTKEQTLYWLLKIYEQLQLDPHAPIYIRCGEGTRKLLYAHLNTQPL